MEARKVLAVICSWLDNAWQDLEQPVNFVSLRHDF